MKFTLSDGFLLGTASAATQIEGGGICHSWSEWEKMGHIKDGSSLSRANDGMNRWKEDIDLMKSMGLQIYRFGLEWARIEPRPGFFDESAISYYKGVLEYLKERDIKPLVTLHHFTNPLWFEEKGGFTDAENMVYFLRFVEKAVSSFGGLANEYITVNEPNVYATCSFYFGEWPPGEKSLAKTVKILSVMAACHIKAYELIHSCRKRLGFTDTRVGFAHHMRVFQPKNHRDPRHAASSAGMQYLFQTAVSHAFYTGRFDLPLRKPCPLRRGEYADFHALNYYSRSTVSGLGDGVRDEAPKNDLGWEIYPLGIAICAEEMFRVLERPIYITENGTCDNGDAFRSRFLYDHLMVIAGSRLPFERFYHWCFCDNFEWLEGESARFGLVHIDYPTQERTVKKSGRFFSEIIKNHGVSEEMFAEFVEPEFYHE